MFVCPGVAGHEHWLMLGLVPVYHSSFVIQNHTSKPHNPEKLALVQVPLDVEHRLRLGLAPDYDHLTVTQTYPKNA
jgi:hypothetical protein